MLLHSHENWSDDHIWLNVAHAVVIASLIFCQPHICTCVHSKEKLSCDNPCYSQVSQSLIEQQVSVLKEEKLIGEVERLRWNMKKLQRKCHTWPPQNIHGCMVKKLDKGETEACTKLHQKQVHRAKRVKQTTWTRIKVTVQLVMLTALKISLCFPKLEKGGGSGDALDARRRDILSLHVLTWRTKIVHLQRWPIKRRWVRSRQRARLSTTSATTAMRKVVSKSFVLKVKLLSKTHQIILMCLRNPNMTLVLELWWVHTDLTQMIFGYQSARPLYI
jgi:hypothetical protein